MLTKEKRPLDFHRASIGPRSISFLFEKSTPLRAPFPRLLPPFSFPNRFATSNFSSPHNSSFTDHFSATSHQPCSPPPRATSRFVSFLPPYPLLDSEATSFIPPTWGILFSLLSSLRILSRRSTAHKKQLGLSELSVQAQVIRFPRNEIDRLRRVNKTSVLDPSPRKGRREIGSKIGEVKRRCSILKEKKLDRILRGIID